MQRFLSALLALLLVAQPLLPSLAFADKETQVRVLANSLNVRSGPGTDNPAVDSIKKGEVLTLVSQEGEWAQVRLPDGTLGWVAMKFLERIDGGSEPTKEDRKSTPPEPKPLPPPKASKAPKEEGSGGGSAIGSVFKWGCLIGAGAAGGLAFSEHSKGNDSYDSYKEFAAEGNEAAADSAFADSEDHDSKAQTFAIVGGSLFALFLLQQFVLGGHGDSADGGHDVTPPLTWNPATGEVRATLVLARF